MDEFGLVSAQYRQVQKRRNDLFFKPNSVGGFVKIHGEEGQDAQDKKVSVQNQFG